jgi:ABC-2 type transporter
MLTVKETLDLAAFLEDHDIDDDDDDDEDVNDDAGHDHQRSRSSSNARRREDLVNTTLKQLGLWHVRNRRIGQPDATTGGENDSSSSFSSSSSSSSSYGRLSGGERRRLSLGLELVARPELFVGDEPTTGLDTSMSDNVVRLIKRHIVRHQIPGLLSLHQPRSSIWQQLDYVMLLATGGFVIYFGPTNEAVDYFARLGYACPKYTNPAEYLLDLISVKTNLCREDTSDSDTDDARTDGTTAKDALTAEERTHHLADAFIQHQQWQLTQGQLQVCGDGETRTTSYDGHPDNCNPLVSKKKRTNAVSIQYVLERFRRLLLRSWRQNIRDHKLNAVRLVVSIGNAFLFGNVFKVPFPVLGVNDDVHYYNAKTIPDRTGLLAMGVINMVMLTVMKTIDLLSKEKPVVLREQRRRQYSCLEYLLSKSWTEMPLDIMFSLLFATVIKTQNGLRIPFVDLALVFAMMTICGASLGLGVGAWSSSQEVAMAVGVPLMIILLSVGLLTQGDVADTKEDSLLTRALKSISPIYYANKAVCLQEYHGMIFRDSSADKRSNDKIRLLWNLVRGERPNMKSAMSMVNTGDDIIEELGIDDASFDECIQRLIMLSILFLVISWIGLVVQTSRGRK